MKIPEELKVIPDKEINGHLKDVWQITSRTETTDQLTICKDPIKKGIINKLSFPLKIIMINLLFIVIVSILKIALAYGQPSGYTLNVDASIRQGSLSHFWTDISQDKMYILLEPGVQDALRIQAKELGFKRIRAHGILNDDVGLYHWDGIAGHSPWYSWTNFDKILDFLISINMDPIMELSFMPKDLALETGSGKYILSVPKDWGKWRELVYEIVKHCMERYGRAKTTQWHWEVWNEPDLLNFQVGNWPADYCKLYQLAFEGALAANPDIKFCAPDVSNIRNASGFLDSCNGHNIKFDYFSWHVYASGESTDADPYFILSTLRLGRELLEKKGFKDKPQCIHEWGPSWSYPMGGRTLPYPSERGKDTEFGAAFAVKTVKIFLDEIKECKTAPQTFAYWCSSDIYEEDEDYRKLPEFYYGFGITNRSGINKPVYNGFKMLHSLGDIRISLTGGCSAQNDGVDGVASLNNDSTVLCVLAYNFYKNVDSKGTDTIKLLINNIPFNGKIKIEHYRVDSTHSNAFSAWENMGSPHDLNADQLKLLKSKHNLERFEPDIYTNLSTHSYIKTIALPRQSVSLITMSLIKK
jgi:xylan 1,4-beta-xylosidase